MYVMHRLALAALIALSAACGGDGVSPEPLGTYTLEWSITATGHPSWDGALITENAGGQSAYVLTWTIAGSIGDSASCNLDSEGCLLCPDATSERDTTLCPDGADWTGTVTDMFNMATWGVTLHR